VQSWHTDNYRYREDTFEEGDRLEQTIIAIEHTHSKRRANWRSSGALDTPVWKTSEHVVKNGYI